MRCLKIPRRYLIYCFGFLFSLFFTFSFCSSSSFAVSDLTYNFSDCASYPYCFSSGVNLYSQGYRFLTVYFENLAYNNQFLFQVCDVEGNCNSTHSLSLPGISHTYVIKLDPFYSRRYYFSANCGSSSYFTLSENAPDLGGSIQPPFGSLSITENGTYDVSSYAEAVVDVPIEVVQGDYHDDLTTINQSILICGAILLVIYFFYAIYRMIMRGSHGRQ